MLSLDLPFERTSEIVVYRKNLIDLEQATRAVQQVEDEIKREVHAELELQRDIGLLEVDEQGMWKEFIPPSEEDNDSPNR